MRNFRFPAALIASVALAALGTACAPASGPAPGRPGSRAVALARPAATTPPKLAVPPPTGPDHVGTIAVPVFDPSRHRELMIQIWYPTRATRGRPAPYFTPAVARLVAAAEHVPVSVTTTIVTHALEASTPAPGRHPVVLYSPGSGEMRNAATAQVEELASRGFVTVGIDHPGDSQFVQFPDGRIVRGTFHDTGCVIVCNTREVRVRVADVAAVLRALPAISRHGLLAGALDLRHIGMFGFSLGGATAAAAMRHLPAIQAGLDIDGSLYGDAVTTPLTRPFLLLANSRHNTQDDPSWRSGWRALHGFRREIELRRSGHLSFTDILGFIDTLGLRSRYPPGLLGTISAPAAVTATRELITAYFDYFLKHDKDALTMLNTPSQQNRYLLRLR